MAQGRNVKYFGREGRRTPNGYKILHIVDVNGNPYEIAAKTKEEAIEQAIGLDAAQILPRPQSKGERR